MIKAEIRKELQGATDKMFLNIQLDIAKGELVTLYGPSGAGKTSILRILAGLLSVDEGRVSVQNQKWLDTKEKIDLTPQQRSIGYVFQDYALFPNMTVRKNLEFALRKDQDKSIVDELIAVVELERLQHRKSTALSGGQQQRVALARALVREPKLLLLDEPLSALDIKMRRKLQDYILKVHRQYELTTILVSHDIGEIIKMSDKIYCLEGGKIVKQGNPITVFTDNKTNGTLQFTGEVVAKKEQGARYVITVFMDQNVIEVIVPESDAIDIAIGDKVVVAFKAFQPILSKIEV